MSCADLYIRVSTEEQKTTGFSQRYQEEILKTYCKINSINIDRVVFEDYSAKTFNRPEWNKLFATYKQKKFAPIKLLLVTKWDRFSRNTADAYYMLNKLSKLGIEVRAIEQPLDISIPENKMMMAFFLTVPEVENERRGLEIKKGRQRGAKEGRWMGLAPYGYINKLNEAGIKCIEPKEPQAGIIRFAFQELSNGLLSVSELHKSLIKYGFDKSLNCLWNAIRNPVYCGKILLRKNGNPECDYAYGQHKAIISEDLFLKVQTILNRRKIHTRGLKNNDQLPLRGFLNCPICKKTMTGSGSTGKKKRVYYYYHCQSKCHTRFPAEKIHLEFNHLLAQLIPTFYFNCIYQKVKAEMLRMVLEESQAKKKRLMLKIESFNYKINRIKSLLLNGNIEPTDYKSLKEEADFQKSILEESLILITKEIESIQVSEMEDAVNISNLDKLYNSLTSAKKKALVSHLFPFGVVYNGIGFNINNVSAGIQPIYLQSNLEVQQLAENKKGESNFAMVDDTKFFQRLISTIVADNLSTTLRQAKDIIRFFKTLAHLSMKIDPEPM